MTQLTIIEACTATSHVLTWVPPLTGEAHWVVLTTLLLTPLVLQLSGRLLYQLSLYYMNNNDIINLMPLQCSLLILAFAPLLLLGLLLPLK